VTPVTALRRRATENLKVTTLRRPPRHRLRAALLLAGAAFLATSLLGLLGSDPAPPTLSAAAAMRPAPEVAAAPPPAGPDAALVLMPTTRSERATRRAERPPAEGIGPGAETPPLWRLAAGPPVEIRVGRTSILGAPVHLADGVLEDLGAGDLLTLPIPDIGSLDVEIERVAEPSEGITVLQGHLADPEETWPVSLTRGPGLVLANVATPTGTWIAEFSGGRGWIAQDDLEDRLVDHSVSDAREPVGEGHAPGNP
jgi:hypothetical protein